MYRRTLSVTYVPIRNNFVLLPDNYYRIVSTYLNGCLNLSFDGKTHYVSWAPYPGAMKDHEIGMSSHAAKAAGLIEGSLVECSLIGDSRSIKSLEVSPIDEHSWQILESTSSRIQSTMLDQTKVVYRNQLLTVWVNRTIHIQLRVENVQPSTIAFGKIENDTELHINPFKKSAPVASESAVLRSSSNKDITELRKKLRERPRSFVDKIDEDRVVDNKLPAPLLTNGIHRKPSLTQAPLQKSSTLQTIPDREPYQLSKSATQTSPTKKPNKLFSEVLETLKRESSPITEFRVVSKSWDQDDQLSDVFVATQIFPSAYDISQIFQLKTRDGRKSFVRIRQLNEPTTSDNVIVMNEVLMKVLELGSMERVTLKPRKQPLLNFIDQIQLIPDRPYSAVTHRNIEDGFKELVLAKSREHALKSMLLTQGEIIRLADHNVTVQLVPESCEFCLVDRDVLKTSKIVVSTEQSKNVDSLLKCEKEEETQKSRPVKAFIEIESHANIVNQILELLKVNLCLDDRSKVMHPENIILQGPSNSGKSQIAEKISEILKEPPFFCYFETFNCAKHKGRKPESIQRDLHKVFVEAANFSPSVFILENIDILTKFSAEHTQDGEYFNRVSGVICNLIEEFTTNSSLCVLATLSNLTSVNQRLVLSRGEHLFHHTFKIPSVEITDREQIIKKICLASHCIMEQKEYYKKLASFTEGYKIGDLVHMMDRVVFYAVKQNPKSPVITEDQIRKSLDISNSYCLKGIENYNDCAEDEDDDGFEAEKIPGMETPITTMEEVLMWPAKYSQIFSSSPLRNQAGILLFGPPGTGKTYLVSKLIKSWNLRLISVKGPELLAKYIGQSEENVRNLFERARSAKPCVLFFDEFDSLAPRRGHDSTGVTDRVVNQLLTELDGVEGLVGVTVIGATSRPELLDPALLRSGRMDRLVECSLPNAFDRQHIFETLSKNLTIESTVDWKLYAGKTTNFTGADIKSILTTANMTAVQRSFDQTEGIIPEKVLIMAEDIESAFVSTRPSLSPKDIARYKVTYAQFTNKEQTPRDFVAKKATFA